MHAFCRGFGVYFKATGFTGFGKEFPPKRSAFEVLLELRKFFECPNFRLVINI
jgi:hypothetical protein